MEQNLIYYIDQYLGDQFISRSEPYYSRQECEQTFENLCDNSCESIYYRINVSLPLKDYENLVLASNKIRIRFLEKPSESEPAHEPAPEAEPTPEPIINKIKAFKYVNGYLIFNNNKNRNKLLTIGYIDHFTPLQQKKLLLIEQSIINDYNLNFSEYFRPVKLTDKVINLLNN